MKVVIADGHPTTRLGIKSLLLTTEASVVGEVDDGEELVRLVEETKPDLVILDLNLDGEVDGPEICRRTKASGLNPPRVLVHTANDSAEEVSSCLLAGADSCLPKWAVNRELLDAIQRTAAGERVWNLDDLIAVGERSRACSKPDGGRLTPREREVVGLVLRRYSNARIAEEMHVSQTTVKTHVRNILGKLGLKSRWELFHRHVS